MHDDMSGHRPGAQHDLPSISSARRPLLRAHRTSPQHVIPALDPGKSGLAAAVLTASKGSRIDLDEQYLLTVFVVHRKTSEDPTEDTTPVVVELLDHGAAHGMARWQVIAHNEFSGAATPLAHGASAEQALRRLDWHSLDQL